MTTKKKKASKKPKIVEASKKLKTTKGPISLSDFGPIIYEDGYGEDLYWNLAAALVYVYNEFPGVRPEVECVVAESKLEYDEDDLEHEFPSRNDEGEHRTTLSKLLKLWKSHHNREYNHKEVSQLVVAREEDRRTPKKVPMQMRGWANHGAG